MKKLMLMALACLFIVSCAAKKEVVKKPEVKKETPIWRIISYNRGTMGDIDYKDKWYRYNVKLDFVHEDGSAPTMGFMTSCRVSSAEFTVYDRKTDAVVRTERLSQPNCASCHKR